MNLNSRVSAFDRRDHRRPVVVDRLWSGTSPPGTLEDMVQHEHRHVAPDTVTLLAMLETVSITACRSSGRKALS